MESNQGPSPDPFVLDAEQLQALASPAVVRRGIAYFKENRVTDLGWDSKRLWAAVEGTRPGGYQVEVELDDDGELWLECDCPFEWESACKHMVATLLAYRARQPISSSQVEGAADAAIDARARRGQSEVVARHVAGDRWLGTWEAHSLTSSASTRSVWQVELRSVSDRINSCTCPDFATNRLGTCKHIEAVLYQLRKGAPKKFDRLARVGPPNSIVHLDWAGPQAPRIRLRRAGDGGASWLDEFFDGEGTLRGSLPEAFERLEHTAIHRPEVVITHEVHAHLARLAQEEEKAKWIAQLSQEIRGSQGKLEGIAAKLYPYQVDGVAHLAGAGRALLADDMGLGKTLQAIAATVVLRRHQDVRRALVVCPSSLKHQWVREVERFSGLEALAIQGSPNARLALYRRRAAFSMVNYEVVLRDWELIQNELSPDLLILDEAQRIKNWRTKTAAAVKRLETPFAFVLSGTPLENRLEDLYSLMQVVDPRALGPLWRYLLDFHVTDERGKVLGYRNLNELRRRLAPVMLRRDKSLVKGQLPERIDHHLDIELDRRQRDLHDEAMSAATWLAQIATRRPLTPPEEKRLMASLQRARMACNAAGLVDKKSVGSPKLTELESLLEQLCLEGGRKVVVFSQWERMTHMAEGTARTLGLGTVRLHGGVPSARRGKLIDRFRDDPAIQVFLSTDAGGVGLNLQAASALINLDLPWNPAVLEQRIGRIHRLGQSEPVQVISIMARDSYEERIAALIGSKRELFRNVMTDEATEDTLGLSRRALDAALSSLEDGADRQEPGTDRQEPGTDSGATDTEPRVAAQSPEIGDDRELAPGTEDISTAHDTPPTPIEDESLAPFIDRLQRSLAERLEQIVALGGSLVVVVDRVDDATEELVRSLAAHLENPLPFEVVDARSWAALSRLGPLSPTARATALVEPSSAGRSEARPDVTDPARRKLAAARVLAEQGHGGEALELATLAMLHTAATRAGLEGPPSREQAALWLHTEVVPSGALSPEATFSIGRGLALAGVGDIPSELLATILADAESLLSADSPTPG